MCPTRRYPNKQNPGAGSSGREGSNSPSANRYPGRDPRTAGSANRPNVVGSGNYPTATSRGLRSSDQIDRIRNRAAQEREAKRAAESGEAQTSQPFQQVAPGNNPGHVSQPFRQVAPSNTHKQPAAAGNASGALPSSTRKNPRRTDTGNSQGMGNGRPRPRQRQASMQPDRRRPGGRPAPAQQNGKMKANSRRNAMGTGSIGAPNLYTGNQPGNGRRKRKGSRISPLKLKVAAVIVVVLLVAGGIDSLINGDRIYAGVQIGDVSVAGMTKEEASSAVSAQYAERVSSNVDTFFATQNDLENPKETDTDSNIEQQISYEQSLSDRTQWTVTGNEVDAELNIVPLVDEAFEVGRSNLGPVGRVLSTLFGYSIDPACSFNDSLLDTLRDQMTAAVGTKRVNYDIKVEDGIASVTDGNEGDEVTRKWLTDHLNAALLSSDQNSKDVLETEHLTLQVREADAQKVADTVNKSISAGAVFKYEDQSWTASKTDLGSWVKTSVVQDGGGWKLQPSFDADSAKPQILSSLHSNVQDEGLTVTFDKDANGTITVSTTAQGSVPLASEAVNQMNETFFANQERTEAQTVEVQSASIPSTLSLDDAYAFGLIGEISSFTTQYSSGASERINNIHTAASLLNNSICKAGEKWSFNDIAGEATEDKGYQSAHAIVGGSYTDAVGGGICQVATTVFNSVYTAGYPVPRRYNHTLYIESYPKGRDAAIAYPDKDLVWQNDTSSDVLLVMSYTSTSVTCTLVGVSPQYQVSTDYGEWQAGQSYSTTYKTDNTLASGKEYVESTGVNGSSITIVRTVKDKSGNVLHKDEFTSNYSPKNKVIVKGTA